MSEVKPIDEYYELLGIPPVEQPPTYYRLLGLSLFESNLRVIERASDRQTSHLRSMQIGPHAHATQRLLNEVSKATRILLSEKERSEYDSELRKRLQPVTYNASPAATPPASYTLPRSATASQTFPSAHPENTSPALPLAIAAVALAALLILALGLWQVFASSSAPKIATNALAEQAIPAPPSPPGSEGNVSASTAPQPPPTRETNDSSANKPKPNLPESRETAIAPAIPADEERRGQVSVEADSSRDTEAEVNRAQAEDIPPTPQTSASTIQARLAKEVQSAKLALRSHPKFSKYYESLQTKPETVVTNSPKFAAILWQEAIDNPTINSHPPSYVAMLEEVEHLASVGGDYRLALQAIAAQEKLPVSLRSPPEVHKAKVDLILAAARAAAESKSTPERLADAKRWVQESCADAARAKDHLGLAQLLEVQTPLLKTSDERLQVATWQVLAAESALRSESIEISAELVKHAQTLLETVRPSKARKDVQDRLEALMPRVRLAVAAIAAQKKLAANPKDPAANQAVAVDLLFNRRQWESSLAHFAQGSDPTWKQLALASLAADEAKARAAIAQRWMAAGAEADSPARELARQMLIAALRDEEFVGIDRAAAEANLKILGPSLALQATTLEVTAAPIEPPPRIVNREAPERSKSAESKPTVSSPRGRWINKSYDSVIYHIKGKEWAEFENKTMKTKWRLNEIERTVDYVVLFNPVRKQTWRLTKNKMEIKNGQKWDWLANGHWEPSE